MILIAESGSTKTDWVHINNKGIETRVQSSGINPFFQDSESIYSSIKLLQKFKNVELIYFYGAGCANEEKNQIVKTALLKIFPDAKCEINSDLLAAARSLCKNQKGIACILGTGSNSCYYNGENIEYNVSPLGFILGDEGSGAVLGKKLIADILKNQAPKDMIEAFIEKYNLQAAEIVQKVYREEFPNRFLAQFTMFLFDYLENKYVDELIVNSFSEFIVRNIKQYPNNNNLPVHFTGSIAYHFKEQLEKAAVKSEIQLGKILKSPLEGLIQFHSNK
ncbi:MAG: ATPase [Marinifilum sp.]|jgi:N-acetylglucosamine kinase-like BadF-type ATPase|nr:ATPase [Marinifilum sp.]